MATPSTSDAKPSENFDPRGPEVLAYRRPPSERTGTVEPNSAERGPSGTRKNAEDAQAPPIVLRMPDLSETAAEPSWEPVLRPIRYKLILAALGLCAVLMALCYWILKADVSPPQPEEAPPWDGNRWNSGPVKVERPAAGRISTHQPVPTWNVTALPEMNPGEAGRMDGQNRAQGQPHAAIRGVTPLDEPRQQMAPSEDPGVAHLKNRIDLPQTKPDYERARSRLY